MLLYKIFKAKIIKLSSPTISITQEKARNLYMQGILSVFESSQKNQKLDQNSIYWFF
jgi:hypothetical protein